MPNRKNLKIYLVTSGEYSDYHINGIFDNKELAEKFIEAFNNGKKYYDMNIEEWSLNTCSSEIKKGCKPYFVRMAKDGTVIEIEKRSDSHGFADGKYDEHPLDVRGNLFNYCWAKDDNHAIKITNEKRTRMIAENEWINKNIGI